MDKKIMNNDIQKAIWLLWATIVVGAIVILIDKWSGYIGEGEFVASLIIYGLSAIIPYKISQGSNGARYFFMVLIAISIIASLGMSYRDVSPLSVIASIIELVADAIILFWLFRKTSNPFFTAAAQA